uniref:Uncharacterized protein n=1 Tax=Siphoviridae sp. ctBLh2 TaxID=2827803 RepID=A0A8S5S3L3_9CAUD|nr:MAG TPA: hypothetical protein [Siphoviridae sp. ctBLh2]
MTAVCARPLRSAAKNHRRPGPRGKFFVSLQRRSALSPPAQAGGGKSGQHRAPRKLTT